MRARLPRPAGLVLAAGLALAAGMAGLAQPAQAQLTFGYSMEFEPPTFPFKKAMRARFNPELEPLYEELQARQAAGDDVTCSLQIYREAHWLVGYTADAERAQSRIEALRESLKEKDQSWALQQSPEDGSWGACYDTWVYRLWSSVDPLKQLQAEGRKPEYPLAFLEPVDSWDKLKALLDGFLTSDIDAGSNNHRRELNLLVTAMGQLLLLPELAEMLPEDYPRQEIRAGFLDYLDNVWQNPETGYWGAWYIQHGKLIRTDDLSLTFHIVSYRRGDVPRMKELVDTTFSLRETHYPYGWQDRGTTNNHHNYDVATILKYGWDRMTVTQKVRAGAEISIMLARCLRLTIDGQGRFYTDSYDNVGDAWYFGVSFLDVVGYFDPKKRFWGNGLKIPEAANLRETLIANLRAMNSRDPMILAALRKLERSGSDEEEGPAVGGGEDG